MGSGVQEPGWMSGRSRGPSRTLPSSGCLSSEQGCQAPRAWREEGGLGRVTEGSLGVVGKAALPDRSLMGGSDPERRMTHTSHLPAREQAGGL